MDRLTHDELLEVMTAGARLAPEKSRALPASSYRDPAQSIRFGNEVKCRERTKKPPKPNKKWR